jgi:hypothetical protein
MSQRINSYIYIMNLTRNQISFLRNIPAEIDINKRSDWRHYYFEGFNTDEIQSFIKSIGEDKIYLLIPQFSNSKSLSDPILSLSEPFLVDNKSNPLLITNFVLDQWKISGFRIDQDIRVIFSLKWKRVWFINI